MRRALYFILALYALTGSVICGPYESHCDRTPQDFKDAGP